MVKDLTLRTLTLWSLLLPFWRRFLHPDWWPLCGQGLWGLHEPGSVGEELSSLAFASAWSADCFNSIGWWLHLWVAIHLGVSSTRHRRPWKYGRGQCWATLSNQLSSTINYWMFVDAIFTPLRVGWPPTPQVYFGPWEGLRVVFPRGGSPS